MFERIERMKKYIRSLDSLGRIELPREMLRNNLFEEGTLFHISTIAEGVLLIPVEGSCALCGGNDNLIKAQDGFICRSCINEAAIKSADN